MTSTVPTMLDDVGGHCSSVHDSGDPMQVVFLFVPQNLLGNEARKDAFIHLQTHCASPLMLQTLSTLTVHKSTQSRCLWFASDRSFGVSLGNRAAWHSSGGAIPGLTDCSGRERGWAGDTTGG